MFHWTKRMVAVLMAAGLVGFGIAADLEIDGKKGKLPAGWKEETPTNQMRLAQFKIPKVGDDAEDAELIIFKGLGGSATANIDRTRAMACCRHGRNQCRELLDLVRLLVHLGRLGGRPHDSDKGRVRVLLFIVGWLAVQCKIFMQRE